MANIVDQHIHNRDLDGLHAVIAAATQGWTGDMRDIYALLVNMDLLPDRVHNQALSIDRPPGQRPQAGSMYFLHRPLIQQNISRNMLYPRDGLHLECFGSRRRVINNRTLRKVYCRRQSVCWSRCYYFDDNVTVLLVHYRPANLLLPEDYIPPPEYLFLTNLEVNADGADQGAADQEVGGIADVAGAEEGQQILSLMDDPVPHDEFIAAEILFRDM